MTFRHEWKHLISPGDLLALRRRLGLIARPDSHGRGGRYFIRSLYFDTPWDQALRDKINGVDRREKFRIRCYDLDPSFIRLEKKSKVNGLCRKQAAPLSAGEARALAAGETDWMESGGRDLVWELRARMAGSLLRPRTIVDYTREAFVFGPGDVRVTLDYNIRTGLAATDLLSPACVTVPAPGDPLLLEVKWGAYLPDVIRDAVQLPGRRTEAFSKYEACRRYD